MSIEILKRRVDNAKAELARVSALKGRYYRNARALAEEALADAEAELSHGGWTA